MDTENLEKLSNWPISNLDFNLQVQYICISTIGVEIISSSSCMHTSKYSISKISSFGALWYYFSIMRTCTNKTATYDA